MAVYVTTTNRGRVWAVMLAALLALALVAALLVLLPLAALTLLGGLLVAGATLLAQRTSALWVADHRRPATPGPNAEAGPTLQIVDANGDPRPARAIPLAGPSAHTFALTRDGYVLLDPAGKVIHRL